MYSQLLNVHELDCIVENVLYELVRHFFFFFFCIYTVSGKKVPLYFLP